MSEFSKFTPLQSEDSIRNMPLEKLLAKLPTTKDHDRILQSRRAAGLAIPRSTDKSFPPDTIQLNVSQPTLSGRN